MGYRAAHTGRAPAREGPAVALPVRVFKVINSAALVDEVVRFRAAAPDGAIVTILVNGRRERVELLGYLVADGRGTAYAAEFLDVYL